MATQRLRQIGSTVLDTLALAYGGEPRTVGWVIEVVADGCEPRGLARSPGGPRRPSSQLDRLRLGGVAIPELNLERTREALDHLPRARLWVRTFVPIAGEGRWDVRILRLCSLLEGIAREVVPRDQRLQAADGTDLLTHDNKPATTKDLRGKLFFLAQAGCEALAIPEEALVVNPGSDLWTEAGVWADLRNVVGHDGHWRRAPAFTGLPRPRQRSEAAAASAAQGGELEDGLLRYADAVSAVAELILRQALLGAFDSPQ